MHINKTVVVLASSQCKGKCIHSLLASLSLLSSRDVEVMLLLLTLSRCLSSTDLSLELGGLMQL